MKTNPLIFQIAIAILLIIAIVFIWIGGFDIRDKFSIRCDPPEDHSLKIPLGNMTIYSPCRNPLYHDFENCMKIEHGAFCDMYEFPPGFVYGSRPPMIISWFPLIAFLVMGTAFLINYFIYNVEVEE